MGEYGETFGDVSDKIEVIDLKRGTYVYMYCVLINEENSRVLVSGKAEDMKAESWRVDKCFGDWYEAYEHAVDLADTYEYVLEWYVEEQMEAVEKMRIILLRPS